MFQLTIILLSSLFLSPPPPLSLSLSSIFCLDRFSFGFCLLVLSLIVSSHGVSPERDLLNSSFSATWFSLKDTGGGRLFQKILFLNSNTDLVRIPIWRRSAFE